jgi:hypothetical protein
MKATIKKILITILAIIITATIAYAKVSCKRMVSEGAFYNHPEYKALVACYQMCPPVKYIVGL